MSVVGVATKTTPLWDGEDLAGSVGLPTLPVPLPCCPVLCTVTAFCFLTAIDCQPATFPVCLLPVLISSLSPWLSPVSTL